MEDQKDGGRRTTNKLILKEFRETNYKSFSDGQIAISFPNEEDLTHVKVVLTPTGGPYAGATVAFTLRLPASYPNEIATVQCVSKILHPNISKTGAVCFNVFGAEWDSCMRLVDYAHALLWLLYQPNLDSRLNSECPHNRHEFERLVRQMIKREELRRQVLVTPITPRSVEELAALFRERIKLEEERARPIMVPAPRLAARTLPEAVEEASS